MSSTVQVGYYITVGGKWDQTNRDNRKQEKVERKKQLERYVQDKIGTEKPGKNIGQMKKEQGQSGQTCQSIR